MSLTAILVIAQSLSLDEIFKKGDVHRRVPSWLKNDEHAVKIHCVPAEAVAQKPEDTSRVQAGSGHSDHGHSSGPREEHHRRLSHGHVE